MGACWNSKQADDRSTPTTSDIRETKPLQQTNPVPPLSKLPMSPNPLQSSPAVAKPPPARGRFVEKKTKMSLKGLGLVKNEPAEPKFTVLLSIEGEDEKTKAQVSLSEVILVAVNRGATEKSIVGCQYGGIEVNAKATFADLNIQAGAILHLVTEENAVLIQTDLLLKHSGDNAPPLCHIGEEDQILKQDLIDLLGTRGMLVNHGWKIPDVLQRAEDIFDHAFNDVVRHLPPADPVRLAVSINYAIFKFECKGDSDVACDIANEALQHATSEVDTLSKETQLQSTMLMQVMRDCLGLWQEGPSSPRSPKSTGVPSFGPGNGPGSARLVMFE